MINSWLLFSAKRLNCQLLRGRKTILTHFILSALKMDHVLNFGRLFFRKLTLDSRQNVESWKKWLVNRIIATIKPYLLSDRGQFWMQSIFLNFISIFRTLISNLLCIDRNKTALSIRIQLSLDWRPKFYVTLLFCIFYSRLCDDRVGSLHKIWLGRVILEASTLISFIIQRLIIRPDTFP